MGDPKSWRELFARMTPVMWLRLVALNVAAFAPAVLVLVLR